MSYYLPGVAILNEIINKYDYQTRSGEKVTSTMLFKKHVWSRVTMLVQTVLIMTYSVAIHILRGAGSLAAGILTLDKEKIKIGFEDIISLFVDVFALAALGFLGTIKPEEAQYLAKTMIERAPYGPSEDKPRICEGVRLEITGIIRGCLALPVGVVSLATLGISAALTGRFKEIKTPLVTFGIGLMCPVAGLFAGVSAIARNFIWGQYGMSLNGEHGISHVDD